jgi:ABC-type multidrug transport system ATPase subunit
MRPSILVLDEPFSGLDFKMVTNMIDIVGKLRQEGASIIFTTHNSFFIETLSDSVAVIKEGRIVYDGPTKEAMRTRAVFENIGDWGQLRKQILSTRSSLLE